MEFWAYLKCLPVIDLWLPVSLDFSNRCTLLVRYLFPHLRWQDRHYLPTNNENLYGVIQNTCKILTKTILLSNNLAISWCDSLIAKSQGVSLLLFSAKSGAPWAKSSSTHLLRPVCAALWRAVLPSYETTVRFITTYIRKWHISFLSDIV